MIMHNERWAAANWLTAKMLCKSRNQQGVHCIFDILGEYAKGEVDVSRAVDSYLRLINAIADDGLDASITVKLTALGALFDTAGCKERALKIAKYSETKKINFEIDMEGRNIVEYTLNVAEACSSANKNETLALQAYLNRTPSDLDTIMQMGIRPRLVKGAYLGDIMDFAEIQGRFRVLVEKAMSNGAKFQIGTHDPEIISWIRQKVGLRKRIVEFSFLKGLADSTKIEMAGNGWAVSEYIPFGLNNGPYVGRRLKYLRELEMIGRAPAH